MDDEELTYYGREDDDTPVLVNFSHADTKELYVEQSYPLRALEELPGGWVMAVRGPIDQIWSST